MFEQKIGNKGGMSVTAGKVYPLIIKNDSGASFNFEITAKVSSKAQMKYNAEIIDLAHPKTEQFTLNPNGIFQKNITILGSPAESATFVIENKTANEKRVFYLIVEAARTFDILINNEKLFMPGQNFLIDNGEKLEFTIQNLTDEDRNFRIEVATKDINIDNSKTEGITATLDNLIPGNTKKWPINANDLDFGKFTFIGKPNGYARFKITDLATKKSEQFMFSIGSNETFEVYVNDDKIPKLVSTRTILGRIINFPPTKRFECLIGDTITMKIKNKLNINVDFELHSGVKHEGVVGSTYIPTTAHTIWLKVNNSTISSCPGIIEHNSHLIHSGTDSINFGLGPNEEAEIRTEIYGFPSENPLQYIFIRTPAFKEQHRFSLTLKPEQLKLELPKKVLVNKKFGIVIHNLSSINRQFNVIRTPQIGAILRGRTNVSAASSKPIAIDFNTAGKWTVKVEDQYETVEKEIIIS